MCLWYEHHHLHLLMEHTRNRCLNTLVRGFERLVLCFRPSCVSGDSPATETPGHVSAKHGAVQSLASSSSTSDQSGTPRQQPTTAAAATAVDPTTTTVVDSIPWGASGTATARGRQVSPQTGGGGGLITGGTTGGSGGGSPRPIGGSGGDDDGNTNSSTWQPWWLGLLLVGGGATAVSMSSTVRTAIMNAVAAIKARLAPGNLVSLQTLTTSTIVMDNFCVHASCCSYPAESYCGPTHTALAARPDCASCSSRSTIQFLLCPVAWCVAMSIACSQI